MAAPRSMYYTQWSALLPPQEPQWPHWLLSQRLKGQASCTSIPHYSFRNGTHMREMLAKYVQQQKVGFDAVLRHLQVVTVARATQIAAASEG